MELWPFVGALAFGLLFAAIGFFALLTAGRSRRIAVESLQWPSVEATITESAVVDDTDSDGARTWHTRIAYTYRAGGADHVSRRLRADGGMKIGAGSEARARAELDPYPLGARVKAFYRPDSPDYAILEPGSTKAARLQTILGGVFLPIGLVVMAGACVVWFVLAGSR